MSKENEFNFKLDQSFLDASNRLGQCLQSKAAVSQPGGSKFTRSDSRESMRSVTSTQSDTIFEKVNRNARNGAAAPLDLQLQQQSMHSSVNLNPGGSGTGDAKGVDNFNYKGTIFYEKNH